MKDLIDIKALGTEKNLLPLVYSQLHKYQDIIIPQEAVKHFLHEWNGLYLKSIAISAMQEAIENEIISLLRENGIFSAVIKGNQIAKELYGDPNCRNSSDIDILIRKKDATIADSILTKAGYIGEEDIPLAYCLSRIHHASYNHPQDNNMLIEVHWAFGVPYFFNLTSEEIWKEVIFTDSGRTGLTPEMIFIMLLIHHHSHSFRELKILVDILWALYKYENTIDWHLLSQKLNNIGLIKTAHIALNQLQSLWKEDVAEMKSFQVLQQMTSKAAYRPPKFLLYYFRMNTENTSSTNIYKDKLIARFALDRRSAILLSYFRTLFPVPEAIKELYDDQRNWVLPVNYFKFIKWRLKEWLGYKVS